MNVFSVWDHHRRLYDYYRGGPVSTAVNAPRPSHMRPQILGATPDNAAWPLPDDAVRVGAGKYPRGHIASRAVRPSLGMLPDFTFGNLVVYGALGFLAYQWWKAR